jgi:hypothetical protein
MKRYMRGFVAFIISLGFMGGVASAQTADCQGALVISNTGPGSTNVAECVDVSKVNVVCNNNVYVVNGTVQTSTSGGAIGSGNTTASQTVTGNAINQNGTTVQIGTACAAPTTAPTPTTTPPAASSNVTPATGLGGSGAVSPSSATAAVLPNTASNPVADIAIASVVTLAGLLATSRLAITAYRRVAS